MIAKRVAVVAGVLAFVASGAYTLIYLSRWEWHRAMIAGLFFVASELAVLGFAILGKLRTIEQRLDSLHRAPGAAAQDTLDRIEETAPIRKPFAWLSGQRGDLNVFLPFLLGAGVLASAVAWVVELVAKNTARPVLQERLALRLAPISLPAGGLFGDVAFTPIADTSRRVGRKLRTIGALIAAGLLAVALVDAIADATQQRPDPPGAPAVTTIEMHLSGNRATADLQQAGMTLWASCTNVLHRRVPPPDIVTMANGRVLLVLETPLGVHARRRVVGCLEDAIVDKIQAGVVSVTPPVRG